MTLAAGNWPPLGDCMATSSGLGLGRVETRRGWFLSDLRLAAKGMPRASGLDGGNQRFDANDVHDPGEIVGEH